MNSKNQQKTKLNDRQKTLEFYCEKYNKLKFVLLPVKGKVPTLYEWTKTIYKHNKKESSFSIIDKKTGECQTHTRKPTIETIIANNKNIGILTGKPSGIIVVDIDEPKDGEIDGKKYFDEILKLDPNYTNYITDISGKGSRRFWYKYNENNPIAKLNVRSFEDVEHRKISIDILSTGKQCVVAPSIHPDSTVKNPKIYEMPNIDKFGEIEEMPNFIINALMKTPKFKEDGTIEFLEKSNLKTNNIRFNSDKYINTEYQNKKDVDELKKSFKKMNDLRNTIAAIDWRRFIGNGTYDTWLKLGFAIYNETGGSIEGFRLYDTFNEKYLEKNCDEKEIYAEALKKWQSFETEPEFDKKITIATLKQWENEDNNEIVEKINLDNKNINIGQDYDFDKFLEEFAETSEKSVLLIENKEKLKEFIIKARSVFRCKSSGNGYIWYCKHCTLITHQPIPNKNISMPFIMMNQYSHTVFANYFKGKKVNAYWFRNTNTNEPIYRPLVSVINKFIKYFKVKETTFLPRQKLTDNVLNTFTGYTSDLLDNVDMKSEKSIKIIFEFERLIGNLTGNKPENTKWFINWIVNIYQRPAISCDKSVILHSDEGAGKDFLLTFLGNYVFGMPLYLGNISLKSTTNNFNSHLVGKLLIGVSEIGNFGGFGDNKNSLKQLIGNNVYQIEGKGKEIQSTLVQPRYVFTTNEYFPIHIEEDGRRYSAFDADMVAIRKLIEENPSYFDDLAKLLYSKYAAKVIANYLRDYELDTELIKNIPKTDYWVELMNAGKSTSTRFSEYFKENCRRILYETDVKWADEKTAPLFVNEKTIKIIDGDFYKLYVEWCDNNKISKKYRKSDIVFLSELHKLKFIEKPKNAVNFRGNKKIRTCRIITIDENEDFSPEKYEKEFMQTTDNFIFPNKVDATNDIITDEMDEQLEKIIGDYCPN